MVKVKECAPKRIAAGREAGRAAELFRRPPGAAPVSLQMGAQGLTVVLRLGKLELPVSEPRETIDQPFIKRSRL